MANAFMSRRHHTLGPGRRLPGRGPRPHGTRGLGRGAGRGTGGRGEGRDTGDRGEGRGRGDRGEGRGRGDRGEGRGGRGEGRGGSLGRDNLGTLGREGSRRRRLDRLRGLVCLCVQREVLTMTRTHCHGTSRAHHCWCAR
jgi:hypothetical protein